MTTLLGPVPCRECRATVWAVRRTAEVPCDDGCDGNPFLHDDEDPHEVHTHAIPDIGPATVVDEQGERHECAA